MLVNCGNCLQRTHIVRGITYFHLKGFSTMQTAPFFGMDAIMSSILDGCQIQMQTNGCLSSITPPAAIWCIGYTIHLQ